MKFWGLKSLKLIKKFKFIDKSRRCIRKRDRSYHSCSSGEGFCRKNRSLT